MRKPTLHFYFDYISPFAYFAWIQVKALCDERDLHLHVHPIVFGKLLDHWGQLGPAEIEPKREWLIKYCFRYTKLHNIEFCGPKYHPFNSLAALRMSLQEVCNDKQNDVVSSIFEAGWSNGKDIGDTSELINTLKKLEFTEEYLSDSINSDQVKMALRYETEEAIKLGIFGVPTIVIDKELFWGNDQFEHISLYLDGKDPIDKKDLKQFLDKERAIDRKILAQ